MLEIFKELTLFMSKTTEVRMPYTALLYERTFVKLKSFIDNANSSSNLKHAGNAAYSKTLYQNVESEVRCCYFPRSSL